MTGLLDFTICQAEALINLAGAFVVCKEQGLSFAGFRDDSQEGQIDLRAFLSGHSMTNRKQGYRVVDSEIDNQCY